VPQVLLNIQYQLIVRHQTKSQTKSLTSRDSSHSHRLYLS
jgi:hypothetical protein